MAAPQGFLYDLLGLGFEGFQLDINSKIQPKVTIRLTEVGAQGLIGNLVAETAVPAFEDVVLPRRNLSAYLHAIGDRSNWTPGIQALELIALRRIFADL